MALDARYPLQGWVLPGCGAGQGLWQGRVVSGCSEL